MDDDWDLTVEEMDAIEKEALERINQERNSSSSSRNPNEVFDTFAISISGFQIIVLFWVFVAVVRANFGWLLECFVMGTSHFFFFYSFCF